MSLSANIDLLRTIELRELLEDEEKISQIIKFNQKFQTLKIAAGNMLVSNSRLAEVSLSKKTTFRDAKLLLAQRYHELQKLRSAIQTKQDQLDLHEKNCILMAKWSLMKKVTHSEEECEILFQKLLEGAVPSEDFLEGFQRSRMLYHVRLVLLKKTQDIMKPEQRQHRPPKTHHNTGDLPMGISKEPANDCHLLYHLTPAVIVPGVYHSFTSVPLQPPFLPRFGGHVNILQPLQFVPFPFHADSSVCPVLHRPVPRWPATPLRLQHLNIKPRNRYQKPL